MREHFIVILYTSIAFFKGSTYKVCENSTKQSNEMNKLMIRQLKIGNQHK